MTVPILYVHFPTIFLFKIYFFLSWQCILLYYNTVCVSLFCCIIWLRWLIYMCVWYCVYIESHYLSKWKIHNFVFEFNLKKINASIDKMCIFLSMLCQKFLKYCSTYCPRPDKKKETLLLFFGGRSERKIFSLISLTHSGHNLYVTYTHHRQAFCCTIFFVQLVHLDCTEDVP